jgi:hypothetical protein
MHTHRSSGDRVTITHIAGIDVTWQGEQGPHLRQRCAWCGATLIDVELRNTAVLIVEGQEPLPPATWTIGALVTIDGNCATSNMPNGMPLPDDACTRIDPAVTR